MRDYSSYTTAQLEAELEKAESTERRLDTGRRMTPFQRTELHDASRRAEWLRRELAQRTGSPRG